LGTAAEQAGHKAHRVAHIGKADWKDRNVARYVRDGNHHRY